MHLQELKQKTPADLLAYAEDLEVENASTLRKQDMMFSILKLLIWKKPQTIMKLKNFIINIQFSKTINY